MVRYAGVDARKERDGVASSRTGRIETLSPTTGHFILLQRLSSIFLKQNDFGPGTPLAYGSIMRIFQGTCFCFAFILLSSANSFAESVQLGNIKFIANTNVRMFKFTGEVKDLSSSLARANGTLSSFELRIPVKSIRTGMDIRDKHMQERIFLTDKGSFNMDLSEKEYGLQE